MEPPQVVILAAGQGTRLRPLTDDRPKCLVPLHGKTLLERQLGAMRDAGLGDPSVLTGYRSDQIEAIGLPTVHNPRYATTNMVASLACARDDLEEGQDLIVSYGDIVFEPEVIKAVLAAGAPLAVAVDHDWEELWRSRMEDPLEDAETLRIDRDGRILELGKKPRSLDDIEGQYIGLFKIRGDHLDRWWKAYEALHDDDPARADAMYMTDFIQHLIDGGWDVREVPIHGGWLEVDTSEDLKAYETAQPAGTPFSIRAARTAGGHA